MDKSYKILNHKQDIHIYQNSFLSWDEAVDFIDKKIDEYKKLPDRSIKECKIVYLVGRYLAGISFEKSQGELFEDD